MTRLTSSNDRSFDGKLNCPSLRLCLACHRRPTPSPELLVGEIECHRLMGGYPSDLTDDEWGLVEPLIPPGKTGGGKRTVIMREVVNGLMYILSTGCQWRAIPKDLPPRSSVYDYFDLWTYDGTLE